MSINYFIYRLCGKLNYGKKSIGGRNFFGRICVIGRGGGNKRNYLFIDFYRRLNQFGYVLRLYRDSNRTAFLALIIYENGLVSYIIATKNLLQKNLVYSGIPSNLNTFFDLNCWAMPLKYIKLFSTVNNVELYPFNGSKFVRSAGGSSILIAKLKNNITLKLSSGWQLSVSHDCIASIGTVSNIRSYWINLQSAGKHRALGFRPKVRGVAKNPCDHPHGGGNGKKSPPSSPVNAWGFFTKGTPTLNTKKARCYRKLFKSKLSI